MLVLDNINKRFKKNKKVLDSINMKFEDSKIYCIVGKNGAGKTTLLNVISSILFPDSGEIFINDKSIYKNTYLRSEIFYVPVSPFFYERLSAKDNLFLISSMFEKKVTLENIIEVFNKVDLSTEEINTPVYNFSSGMKQKLNFASMLLVKPYIILLDEPFNALDQKTQDSFTKLLKEMAIEKHIIIFTSHIANTILNLAEKILVLNNSTIELHKNVDDINDFHSWIKNVTYEVLEK